jgi:diadenosine tetraphosphate (Ap4A) HIT family hydrolase
MAYDPQNIFARILRREIPARIVFEDAHALAFHDIQPQAPVHVLVIPRGAYRDWPDFAARATAEEQAGFVRAIAETARLVGIEAAGYRVLSNIGADGGQEVPHLHVHLFGGRRLGRMVPPTP